MVFGMSLPMNMATGFLAQGDSGDPKSDALKEQEGGRSLWWAAHTELWVAFF